MESGHAARGVGHRRRDSTSEENGVVCAPREGLLRFSPHFYNDEDEVGKVLALLR
jgi:selenocysteine lyase/cysteine desulfurase